MSRTNVATSARRLGTVWPHHKPAKKLPSPDYSFIYEAYQDFRNTIFAKLSIPHGRRNNYRPCWDAECEHLYQVFLRAPKGKATSLVASALLSHFDKKRKNCWFEAVNNIDFTYSSRLTLNIINNLTGRAKRTRRLCPITGNSITCSSLQMEYTKQKT